MEPTATTLSTAFASPVVGPLGRPRVLAVVSLLGTLEMGV